MCSLSELKGLQSITSDDTQTRLLSIIRDLSLDSPIPPHNEHSLSFLIFEEINNIFYLQFYHKKYVAFISDNDLNLIFRKFRLVVQNLKEIPFSINYNSIKVIDLIRCLLIHVIELPIWLKEDSISLTNSLINTMFNKKNTKLSKDTGLYSLFLSKLAIYANDENKLSLSSRLTCEESWNKKIVDAFYSTYQYDMVIRKKYFPNKYPSIMNKRIHYIHSNLEIIRYRSKKEKELLSVILDLIGCDPVYSIILLNEQELSVEIFSIFEAQKLFSSRATDSNIDIDIKNINIIEFIKYLSKWVKIVDLENAINLRRAILMIFFPFLLKKNYDLLINHKCPGNKISTITQSISKGLDEIKDIDYDFVYSNSGKTLNFAKILNGRWA